MGLLFKTLMSIACLLINMCKYIYVILVHYILMYICYHQQLMDKTSLGLAPKSLALEIAQFYADLFMRRAFFSSIMPFKPDVILFLGDYFDGGPYLSDEE